MKSIIAGLGNLLRLAAFIVVLALAAILVPITGTASADEPTLDSSEAGLTEDQPTGDDRLMAVAATFPGFGGMYVDAATDTLYVYSMDAANEAVTEQAIAEALGEDGPRTSNIELLQAEYSFAELNELHKSMMPSVLGIQGVVLTDINEANNSLTVGVEDQKTRNKVEEQLAELGIPREMVYIEKTKPVRLEASLRDRHRPVVGGLQIQFLSGTSTFNCTLGFNAVGAGVRGYVTNSHCTALQGGVQNTVHHQALRAVAADRIGVEIRDPFYFTGGVCPAGRRCRFSDSSFGRYDSGVASSQGRIARPNLGSFAWNGISGFRIVGETPYPVVGELLTKVGRTTGRTQGNVTATCQNFNVSGTNITLLCQDRASYASAPGDSGSPIVRITNSPAANDVSLYGIHWGSGGVFSAIGSFNIQRATEMGSLTTCAAGFAC